MSLKGFDILKYGNSSTKESFENILVSQIDTADLDTPADIDASWTTFRHLLYSTPINMVGTASCKHQVRSQLRSYTFSTGGEAQTSTRTY